MRKRRNYYADYGKECKREAEKGEQVNRKPQRRSYTDPDVVDGVTVPDPLFREFDAARRQMTCGPNMTRAARDELFFRAGWNAAEQRRQGKV